MTEQKTYSSNFTSSPLGRPFGATPAQYEAIVKATKEISFSMASDMHTGSLLRTLAASKKAGHFLELGTGTGLATSWILSGMDSASNLITVENQDSLLNIAKQQLNDSRIEFILADGYKWILNYNAEKFDFIFADAMPGKYDLLDETIDLLKPGGLYIIDDMLPQPNWPQGHDAKAASLIEMLEQRNDLTLTKLNWSTGIIITTKI